MKVYVVTYEPDHSNSTIMGVHASLLGAMRSQPGEEWVRSEKLGYWATVSTRAPTYDGYEIEEHEVQP